MANLLDRAAIIRTCSAILLAACSSPVVPNAVSPTPDPSGSSVAGTPTSVVGTPTPTTTPNVAFATANPSASLSGVVLHLAARNVRWDPIELHAPADVAFQIELRNEDTGELHNLLVANGSKPTAVGRIFVSGPAVNGPSTRTYDVPGIPLGKYVFWCAVHPEVMLGTLIVE